MDDLTPDDRRSDDLPSDDLPPSNRWDAREAQARFGELVRRARDEGPQRVAVQDRDEVVVLSAEAFRRLGGERAEGCGTGRLIVEAMQASPHKDVDLASPGAPMPVRDVAL